VQRQLDELDVPYTGFDANQAGWGLINYCQAKMRDGGGANGAVLSFDSSGASLASGLATASGIEAGAAGFERGITICRAHRGLSKALAESLKYDRKC